MTASTRGLGLDDPEKTIEFNRAVLWLRGEVRRRLGRTGDDQVTILAERGDLNEIGIGGLMGLVVLYREK